jgi:hypothetical protein
MKRVSLEYAAVRTRTQLILLQDGSMGAVECHSAEPCKQRRHSMPLTRQLEALPLVRSWSREVLVK